jgi:hypothetical protein
LQSAPSDLSLTYRPQPRGGSCCTDQVLPSGSAKETNDPQAST